MENQPSPANRYPLPAFLEGRLTPEEYSKWLSGKSNDLVKRDKKRGKPYAANATDSLYKEQIHKAVIENGERDPYP
jgi:hypothetical protein